MTTTPEIQKLDAPLTQDEAIASLGRYGYGWSDSDVAGASAQRGLSEAVVRDISAKKNEPEWMLEHRLKALRIFERKPMPNWGSNLEGIHFDNIKYFVRSSEKQAATWDDLPADIKNTYDRLGIPEAEKQRLVSGVAAQYESEVVYHSIREDLEKLGVIFLDTDSGLRDQPELFRKYFGTVIPAGDNKFSALNSAVWSGGSFIYVPPGVHVDIPLQAYFRINTENMGQFERTLIIVDEGAYVHYVEGCTAPIYKSDSLHSAVVEIIVKPGGRCRYTTIQNWSNNVYNLVTKRARAEAGATMEWVDGNIGSKVTMKYPAVWMTGEYAKGEVLSVAFAGEGQHQDTGAKMLHLAPNTSSNIVSKSVARGGGRASYRGLVQVNKGSHGSRSSVKCDALLVDTISRSDTYPYVDIREDDVTMGHEATVSRVSDNQLFYLMSRGLTEDEAMAMVVRGFVEPIAKELPMEYALELKRWRVRPSPLPTRASCSPRSTSTRSRSPAAATRSGDSPRYDVCTACTTVRRTPPEPRRSRSASSPVCRWRRCVAATSDSGRVAYPLTGLPHRPFRRSTPRRWSPWPATRRSPRR
jgi:Fe-S cluster assembly protein SufB